MKKEYGRYVDDFYFFTKNKEEAIILLEKVREKVKELGLKLNEKKTKIQKFSSGFKFLKTKFFCTETGKVVRKLNRKSVPRIKKKMKKFKEWIIQGTFSKYQAMNAYYSWRGYAKHCNCYKVIQKMDKYVEENFQNQLTAQ